MKSSKLYLFLSLLKEGGETELTQFIAYARAESTFIKKKEEVLILLDIIVEYYDAISRDEKTKAELFTIVEEKLGKELTERERNDLMSHLVHTIEEFLVIKELRENSLERNSVLVMALKKRNSPKLLETTISRLLSLLNSSTIGSVEQHFLKWRTLHYQYFSAFNQKISNTAKSQLQNLVYQLNEFWLTATYRYSAEIFNRTNLFQENYEFSPIDKVTPFLPRGIENRSELLIQGYKLLLALLNEADNSVHQELLFDKILDWNTKALTAFKNGKTKDRPLSEKEELLTIHILIINHYNREVLKGSKKHIQAMFDLFKDAEKNKLLLEGGTMSSHNYIFLIKLSIATKETEWRDDFVLRNKNKLIKSEQEIIKELSQLMIDFSNGYENKKDYKSLLERYAKLFQNPQYDKNHYLEILGRIFEIQLLYKLFLFEVHYKTTLEAKITNFQSYLKDKNKGIVKEGNLNFLKMVKKFIIYQNRGTDANYKKFEFISERVWLESILATL